MKEMRIILTFERVVANVTLQSLEDMERDYCRKMVLNLNFQHVIDYHMSVINYQQQNFGNSNSKVITLQIIIV